MIEQEVAYAADGVEMVGFLAAPVEGARGAGVLIGHEGPGLSDHERNVARRLASLGYVAFALDYHGGGRRLSDRAQIMAALGGWMQDPTGIRVRARAALGVLTGRPEVEPGRVAAIGYCFGGTTALELARDGANLAAVVGFHCGLSTARPAEAGAIRCPVLVQIGADDPMVPPEQRSAFEAEMRAAGVDWRMSVFGGVVHTFTNPAASTYGVPGVAYDAQADARSWRAMLDVFAETIDR